jgi:hypothetical protein
MSPTMPAMGGIGDAIAIARESGSAITEWPHFPDRMTKANPLLLLECR